MVVQLAIQAVGSWPSQPKTTASMFTGMPTPPASG